MKIKSKKLFETLLNHGRAEWDGSTWARVRDDEIPTNVYVELHFTPEGTIFQVYDGENHNSLDGFYFTDELLDFLREIL